MTGLPKNLFNKIKQMIFQYTSTQRSDIAALQTAVGGFTEVTVNITASQLLTDLKTGIELVPAAPIKGYYEAYVTLEYTHGTTAYDVTGLGFLSVLINGDYKNIGLSMLQSLNKSVVMVSSYTASGANDSEGAAFSYIGKYGKAINLTTWNNVNPTLGNGTIKAKIKYKIITEG